MNCGEFKKVMIDSEFPPSNAEVVEAFRHCLACVPCRALRRKEKFTNKTVAQVYKETVTDPELEPLLRGDVLKEFIDAGCPSWITTHLEGRK